MAMRKTVLTTVASLAVLSESFADGGNPYGDFVHQQTTDADVSENSFANGAHWSDGTAPQRGYKYYVPSGMVFFTPAGNSQDRTFAGDVLACAGDIKVAVSGGRKVIWSELWLLDGATYSFGSACSIAGSVVVKAAEATPAKYLTFVPNSTAAFAFDASITSEVGTALVFGLRPTETIPTTPLSTVRLFGDLSGCRGTLAVAAGQKLSFYVTGGATLPGTLRVDKGGWFVNHDASVQNRVGTLELSDGGFYSQAISGETCQPIAVTNALVLGRFNLQLTGAATPNRTAKRYPVFRLMGAAAANPPDVTNVQLENVFGSNAVLPGQRFEIESDGEDKVVYFAYDGYVSMTTGNGAGTSSTSSALQEQYKTFWSNSQCPTSETTGWLSIENTFLAYNNDNGSKSFSYPQAKFLMRSGKVFYGQFDSFLAQEFHFEAGSSAQYYVGTQDKYWDATGSIVIHSGDSPVKFKAREYKKVHINCPIRGAGDLELNADESDKVGTYYLEGNNSGFGGGLKLFYSDSKAGPMNVYAGNANAFGGPTASGEFRPDAVTLGNHTRLTFENSMSMNEATRGWKVSGNASINIPGSLAVEMYNSITFDGTLTKEGTGTLCIGGTAHFGDGGEENMPEDGKNVLVVSSAVRLLSADALNGVKITLKPGAQIQLPLNTADKFGIRNTKTGTPFDIQTSDGKIPFRWAGNAAGIAQNQDILLPVCTVREELAAGLADKISLAYSPFSKLHFCGYAIRPNGDNSSTVVACFYRPGFMIRIR